MAYVDLNLVRTLQDDVPGVSTGSDPARTSHQATQGQPEAEQQLGAQFNIRSIPTLALFHQGREVARQAGAMGTADIVRWANSHVTLP